MLFLNKLFHLFYDIHVYREIISQKLKKSLGFFLLFYCCFSLLIGIYVNSKFIPALLKTSSEVIASIKNTIPPSANFVINNGHLTVSGVATPLIIPAPTSLPLSVKNVFFLDPHADLP